MDRKIWDQFYCMNCIEINVFHCHSELFVTLVVISTVALLIEV